MCDTYGADTASEFYKLLSRLVQQAAGWRSAGAVDVPTPGAGAASGAGTAAGGGRKRDNLRALAQKAQAIFKKL